MKAESAERLTVNPFPFPHPSQRLQPLLLRRLPSVLAFLFLLSVVFLSADVPGAAAFLLLSLALLLCLYAFLYLVHLETRDSESPLPDDPFIRHFTL